MDKKLLLAIEGLKGIRRKGWTEVGIKSPESVADHTCAVALCVLFACVEGKGKGVDRTKALTMALIHDLAEALVGDITPADGIPRKEKLAREEKAMDVLLASLTEDVRSELMALWHELHDGRSPEARLVLDADVFERTLQAKIYKDRGEDVDRFFLPVETLKGSPFEDPLNEFLE